MIGERDVPADRASAGTKTDSENRPGVPYSSYKPHGINKYRHFDYRSSVSATTSLPRRGLRMVFLADTRKTDTSRTTWLWLVGHLPEGFRIEPYLISTQPFVWSDAVGLDAEEVAMFNTPTN